MIDQTPNSVREALIESVPILIGRTDACGVVLETEGSIPENAALGNLVPGRTNLVELLADDADEIQAALRGGQARLVVEAPEANGTAHFEVRMIFDRRRGAGAYFLIHDITETRQLQVALLNCVDHEQMRIGQDLHDTLGQELTGIAYRLHALNELAPPNLAKAIGDLQAQISGCLKHARDLAFKLSPHIEGRALVGAFERLCAHLSETFDVECVFDSQLDRPISDRSVAFTLFRIAQEACTNAVRHGAATRIEIRLATGSKNRLEIIDDGVGLDSTEISTFPGMGIPTMKFRAAAIGGALRFLCREPSGTIVRCSFENRPRPEAEPPEAATPCQTCS